ncbi:MAG: hypothetical protein WDM78_14550 [Puia sp.]
MMDANNATASLFRAGDKVREFCKILFQKIISQNEMFTIISWNG